MDMSVTLYSTVCDLRDGEWDGGEHGVCGCGETFKPSWWSYEWHVNRLIYTPAEDNNYVYEVYK